MKIILKNDHKDREKKNEMQVFELSLTKRLEDKYAPRSYAERWRAVRLAALLSSYLFNAYSFVTGAAAIIMLGLMAIGYNTIAIAFVSAAAVGLAMILEIFKRKTAGETFAQGYSTKNWSISGILGTLGITAISIALSFAASYFTPEVTTAAPTRPKIDTSQEQIFTEAIKHKKEQAAAIKKQREWKGRIGNEDQREINKLNTQVAQLEADLLAHRAGAEQKADEKHRAELSEHYNNIDRNQYILGAVTIVTELLFIICFLYMEHYDWKSTLERLDLSDSANPKTLSEGYPPPPIDNNNKIPQQEPGEAPAAKYKPIGFVYGSPPVEVPQELPTKDNAVHIPYENRTETVVSDIIGNADNEESAEPNHEKDNAVHIPYGSNTETVVPEQMLEDLPGDEGEDSSLDTYTVEEKTEGRNIITELVLQKNEKPCAYCGQVMQYKSTLKKFCSDVCKWAAFEARREVKP